jgi:hypothetical protein
MEEEKEKLCAENSREGSCSSEYHHHHLCWNQHHRKIIYCALFPCRHCDSIHTHTLTFLHATTTATAYDLNFISLFPYIYFFPSTFMAFHVKCLRIKNEFKASYCAWKIMTIGYIVITRARTNAWILVAMVDASVAILAGIICAKIILLEIEFERIKKNASQLIDDVPLCDNACLGILLCIGMRSLRCDQYIVHHLDMDSSHTRCIQSYINHRKILFNSERKKQENKSP